MSGAVMASPSMSCARTRSATAMFPDAFADSGPYPPTPSITPRKWGVLHMASSPVQNLVCLELQLGGAGLASMMLKVSAKQRKEFATSEYSVGESLKFPSHTLEKVWGFIINKSEAAHSKQTWLNRRQIWRHCAKSDGMGGGTGKGGGGEGAEGSGVSSRDPASSVSNWIFLRPSTRSRARSHNASSSVCVVASMVTAVVASDSVLAKVCMCRVTIARRAGLRPCTSCVSGSKYGRALATTAFFTD
mmetsp:Transcript_62335/g.147745  ORF Transcript_62335/g.147745 Transcript_62335/m.147745 type:complete len:246 (-) Transcript_62335:1219-1956(-)